MWNETDQGQQMEMWSRYEFYERSMGWIQKANLSSCYAQGAVGRPERRFHYNDSKDRNVSDNCNRSSGSA